MDTNKPPTIKAGSLKKWLRTKFFLKPLREIPRECKTLDLGCGWGISFSVNPGFYGIDSDDECINHLSKKGYKVTKCSILEKLPFPDRFFDYIFTHDVLEHFTLSENEIIFQEAYRILSDKGYFLNIVPNKKGYDYGLKINAGHKYFITKNNILELSGDKFQLVKSYSCPLTFLGKYFTHNKEVILLQKRS